MISVIIPVYNAEKYLGMCLDCLAGQTYKNIEVLMIDDGSKDTSPQICDEYAERYDNFVAVHKENGGCSSARNLGLQKAKGDFIAFVDADDCLDADFYEILITALKQTGSDIAACSDINEYSSNINVNKKHENIPAAVVFDSAESSLESMTAKVNSIEGFVWNKIWKRETLEGAAFRTDVAIVDDAVFTWEVVSKINRSCYVDLPMYHYRIISSSIVRNSNMDKYLKALYGYELMISDAEKGRLECMDGLCTDYIIWNIKTLERMIFMKEPDFAVYDKIRLNLLQYKNYIEKCGLRHRILARKALKSWNRYRVWAVVFYKMKQCYMWLKR